MKSSKGRSLLAWRDTSIPPAPQWCQPESGPMVWVPQWEQNSRASLVHPRGTPCFLVHPCSCNLDFQTLANVKLSVVGPINATKWYSHGINVQLFPLTHYQTGQIAYLNHPPQHSAFTAPPHRWKVSIYLPTCCAFSRCPKQHSFKILKTELFSSNKITTDQSVTVLATVIKA